ncbi:MAG: nucleotidyltransferase family protein, partial [Roseovarius sp.]
MHNASPESALLDLMFGNQAAAVAAAKRLTASEWTALMPAIQEHRLAPLLLVRLQRLDMPAALPTALLQTITRAFEQSNWRSLRLKAELIRLHRLLDRNGIAYAALKGAYVAFAAYPQPALRPMRDLDILVHPSDAIPVFNLLQQQAGYERATQFRGSPAAAMQVSKHLPALRHANSGISIEIHHRLISPGSAKIDLAEDPALWDRIIRHPLGSDHVAFLSPTECLLHLLEHAVYDHHLNNGPLILSDIHHLIQKTTIDWTLFERRAAACGITA